MIDAILVWLALVGVWPFANPPHSYSAGKMALFDIFLHSLAITLLWNRWKISIARR